MNITGLQNQVFSNGICDAKKQINTEQCKFDNGECVEHNRLYPGCFVQDVKMLNNSVCDGGDVMTPECKWDGGGKSMMHFSQFKSSRFSHYL